MDIGEEGRGVVAGQQLLVEPLRQQPWQLAGAANQVVGARGAEVFGDPLAWVCDGQRVPEDLCAARADNLVRRACELPRLLPQRLDEELLAGDYTSAFHANAHRSGGAAHVAV